MTTDDKEIEIVKDEQVDKSVEQPSDPVSIIADPEVTFTAPQQAAINALVDKFNKALEDTLKRYDTKIDELNTSITKKDDEITRLRKVNSEILMSADLRGGKKAEIDFNTTDFNEVDWDEEAKTMLSKIDKRIS